MTRKLLSITFILCGLFAPLKTAGPKDPGLIGNLQPDFSSVKGLICYQCRTNTSDLSPLCDKNIFELTTPEEKLNMSLQCPIEKGAYCFTKITTKGKKQDTVRGCSGPTDKNDNVMRVGCMTNENVVLCLCDTKFCNRADREKILTETQISSLFAAIVLFVNSKLCFLSSL